MNKKIRITVFSLLISAITIVLVAAFFLHRQRLQGALAEFGIHKTEDVTIGSYEEFGLWNDRSLDISTEKDFDLFVDENIMVPVTITDESVSQSTTNEEISFHVYSFEYTNDGHKITGRFSSNSNSKTGYITLLING